MEAARVVFEVLALVWAAGRVRTEVWVWALLCALSWTVLLGVWWAVLEVLGCV